MRIIIDTDIGDDIDDAFAISLALQTPELDLLGITTVFRNSFKRAKIVKALLNSFKRDIPVYAGEDKPLLQSINKLVYEKDITKDADGSVNVPHYLPEYEKYEVQSNAVDYLLKQAREYENELTLVAIGPLTNLAKAYLKDPVAFKKLKQIVMMGGQEKGVFAEWNFRCDPEAAKIVFDSGVPIKMVGINVTKFCKLSKKDIKSIEEEPFVASDVLNTMLKKWLLDNDFKKEPIMHDGLAVAELTQQFCSYHKRKASVCIEGEKRAMVCGGEYEAELAVSVNHEQFIGYMFNRLRRK